MNCLATTIIITCKPTLISDMAVAIDPFSDQFPYFNRSSQRCRLQSLTNLDFNFLDSNLAQSFNHTVEDDNIPRSISSPCFSIAASANMEEDLKATTAPRIEILGGQRVPMVRALVAEVTMAIVSGAQPLLLPSGLGGAYLLQTGNGHSIAVAKPVDEEPLAFNNPKKSGNLMLGQPGMKHSIPVGETGIRELAAYLLDYHGFSGVPPTALVSISHVPFHVSEAFTFSSIPYKVASLQRFVGHDFDAGELGPGSFTVTSVHRIGILDVRVLNLDRHAGNMLVKRCDKEEGYNRLGTAELVPIDHGLCLPECLDDPYFEWLNWPQALVPFSDTELQYISNLDPFKDAELLRTELHSLPESAIRVLIVCTVFLKQTAAAGLCLAEIGEKMTRDFSRSEESFSLLETLCTKAKASIVGKTGEGGDYSHEGNEVNAELEYGMLKFDSEYGDAPCEAEISEVFHVSKPPLVPRKSRANSIPPNVSASMLSSQNQWITHHEKPTVKAKEKTRGDKKDRCTMRSKSLPICVNHDESEGVSFGDMTTVGWDMFLQSFQTLLQEALGKGSTPRLGCSCEI